MKKNYLEKTSNAEIIQLENNNYEEYLEPDYTPSTINKIECYATLIEQNRDLINDALNLGNHIADVYLESQRLNAQVEYIKSVNQVKLANIVAKYKLTQQVIEETFAERRTSLSHFYEELDAAIESNDTTRILNAMKMIGSIVMTSPLADIQNFVAKFEDTSQPLLDF